MQRVEELKPLLDNSAAQVPAPYFAEFVLEAADPRPGVDIAQYPGLVVYHLVRADGGRTWLQTYWSAQDHYQRDGETFRSAMGAAPVAVHGYVSALKTHARPWYRRWPRHTVVLAIAAFLGAVQAIGNYFDWAFMAPQLSLKRETARLNLVQGTDYKESTTLLNTLPVAHRDISLSAMLRAKSGMERKANPLSPIAYLAAGGAQEIVLSGRVPEPGEYELVLEATASAGRLRFADAFRFERLVTVWPAVPAARLAVKALPNGEALLSGHLAVGPPAPAGLECALQIERMPGIAFDGPFDFHKRAPTALRWLTNDRPGSELALLTWRVAPTQGQELLPFQVAFTSSADLDWSKLPERSALHCQYLTRGDER